MRQSYLLLGLVIVLQSNDVNAIDLQPNDARPPPPDINSLQVSYQHSERGDLYSLGSKIATNTKISSDLYLWR
jgi:hypothetical protein